MASKAISELKSLDGNIALDETYINIIKGLSEEQAKLALSTTQLSKAKQEEILIDAGYMASSKAVTYADLEQTLIKERLDDETKELILSKYREMNAETGQIVSTKVLTKEELKELLALEVLNEEQKEAILLELGLGTSNIGLAATFKKLALEIWGAVKAIGSFLLTTPAGHAILAVGALVAVMDLLTVSTKEYEKELNELKENLESIKSECSELESELKSYNDELKTTTERMRELENMDSLSFTEKEEYDNLVATNNELERKIALLELEQEIKDREKRNAFIETMEKDANEGNEYWQDGETGRIAKGDAMWMQMGGYLAFDATEKEYIEQQFATRQRLVEELSEATTLEEIEAIQNQIDEIDSYFLEKSSEWSTNSSGINYIPEPDTEDEKAVNEWLDYIADFQDRMAIAISGDSAKTKTFNRLVDNWQFDDTVQELQDLGREGKVTAEMLDNPKYDEFINKLVSLGVIDSADNLEDIALAFNGIAFEANRASNAVGNFTENLPPTITETVDAIHTKLKPAMDSLADAYSKMFTDNGFTHDGITTSEFTGIKEALDAMKESGLEIDYDEYENFVKVLSDVDSTSDDVHDAFDSMATMMVNASGVVDVTEENFNLLKQQLEELGVTNAEEVLTNIRNIQNELTESGINLTEVTYEEAGAFLASGEASAIASEYLRIYMFQKALAENPLNTAADIEALEELCGTLGITGKYLEKLAHLKYLYASADAGGLWSDYTIQNEIAKTKAELDSIAQEEYQYKVDFDFDGNLGGGSGSGSGSPFDWSDLLDKEIKLLEKQLDAGLIDFDTYLNKRLDLINQYYNEGKIAADEYYAYLEATYENQISIYDKVISAVTKKLNDQIEDLEKQKSVIEESYQLQIDKIQTEIDLLQEEADKKQDLIDLEKARYEAERARTQRTLKLYNGEQFIYTNDPDAVRDAEENLADRELQFNISTLQEKIDALEKEMNDATEQIDIQIEHLQEYIDQWQEVAEAFEIAQNEMLAAQVLGADWESQIFAMRQDALEQFKNNYIAAQQEMANAAWKAAEAQINAAKEAAKGVNGVVGSTDVTNGGGETTWSYNGNSYNTEQDAQAAKNADINSAKTANTNTSIPSSVRQAIVDQIEKRKITKHAKGGVIGKDDDFLSSIAKSVGEDTMVAAREGERILTPLQNKDFEKLVDIAGQLVPVLTDIPFANLVNRNLTPAIAGNAPVNFSIGEIHLHEVQDVDTLSKAIINQFPGRVIQAIKK